MIECRLLYCKHNNFWELEEKIQQFLKEIGEIRIRHTLLMQGNDFDGVFIFYTKLLYKNVGKINKEIKELIFQLERISEHDKSQG